MADDKKKLVDDFGAELDLLQDKLKNIASLLGDQMRNKLSDLTTDAGEFVDQFDKGQDITKKLNTKLVNLQKDINKLSLNRLKLESDLTRVQQMGDKALEARVRKALNQNKLATQYLETTQTTLSKLHQAAEAEKKITDEKRKQNDLGEIAKKKAEDIIKPFKELLTVGGIFEAIVKGLISANENSVWISKNLGYGAKEADIMTDKMQLMSITSDATNVTLKSAREAMVQLSAATGGVAEYSEDALKTQIMLTRQLGLSGEEAAGIYKFSILTGKSSSQVNKEMLSAFANTRNAVRGSANFKETMAAAAKVSGQLAANLQNSPGLITKAIVQAQALGTTLEQTKNQGESLLNWESSIENELKAEVLTGKQLNLERARAAALAGDQVALAEELNKNIGTYDEFQKMNVLQQKSLAEAVGLTADQLSDQLRKQKIATEQGKSLAQVSADELEAAEKRKTIQEKFNNFLEKLMDIIGSIGTALSPFIEALTWILDNTTAVYILLGLWLARSILLGNNFKSIGASIKNAVTGLGSKIFGASAAPAAPTPAAPPGGGQAGGGFMSNMPSATNMLKGAAAVLVLSAAMFVAAKAFQEFANVTWESVIKGGVALLGLAGIAMLLGKAQGAILEGSIAIGILGLALIPLAFALRIATPAIEAFGNVITSVFNGLATVITAAAAGISTIFGSLQNVDVVKLLAIGPALIGIGVGLMALGGGGILAAIGSFLGGDPIEKIERLAAAGLGLQVAATGLQAMATALTQVSMALSAIDTSKLDALGNFSMKMSIGSAAKGITDLITAPIKAIGSMVGDEKESNSNSELVAAIKEVKVALDKLYTKDTRIFLDSKEITTAGVKGSYQAV
jgi:hypothetical protein